MSHDLIEKVFVRRFGIAEPLTDSAILDNSESILTFTTDSYVVNPSFFPAGTSESLPYAALLMIWLYPVQIPGISLLPSSLRKAFRSVILL